MGLARKLPTAFVLLICFLAAAAPASADHLKTLNFSFGPFNGSYQSILHFDSAQVSNDALQLTPDTASLSSQFNLIHNQSGRVMYPQPFKLWEDGSTDRVASFNTSFLFNIASFNNFTPGEGIAFVIAPDLEIPLNSSGQYLGLTNATTDGNATNHLVAVEMDTFREYFDPDNNHIGLNINSVNSTVTASLTPHNITLVPANETVFYVVWIQYDGAKKTIEVYIAQQASKSGPTPPRPTAPVLEWNLDLRNYTNQQSYFGFSGSTGIATELNCVLSWNLTVEYYEADKGPWLKILLGVGVPILLLLVAAAAVLVYVIRKKQMVRSRSHLLCTLRSLPGIAREFPFKELKKATNNFDEKNKLGEGGYGVVYRGLLENECLEVAVKCFKRENIKCEDDFVAELSIINRLRHKHLVRLLGWCHKNGKLLLVYDYMPNGSLDQHLFVGADSKPLSWIRRFKIISGIASALHYLHDEYDQRVVHRDLKASNIMLDSDFNARLGDFGLARALDNEKTSYAEAQGVLGTLGYLAPECFHTGKATQQSDVYAFGVVLLEVVCGLRPGTRIGKFDSLVDGVWALHREGRLLEAVDDRLAKEYEVEEAHRVLLLALACCHPTANERPKTEAVVQIISGSVPGPNVPPFKPAFVWPSMSMGEGDSTQATTTMTGTSSFTASRFESGITPLSISRDSIVPFSGNLDTV